MLDLVSALRLLAERIGADGTDEVLYSGRPSRHAGPHGSPARWDVLDFLARVVDHIPEPSQQTARYWGFYANAARGKRRKAAPSGEAITMPHQQDAAAEFTRRTRLTWAKLIPRVEEVAPLLCPFCGAALSQGATADILPPRFHTNWQQE